MPYATARAFKDLEVMAAEAGGTAYGFGYSSGAILALKDAVHGLAISQSHGNLWNEGR